MSKKVVVDASPLIGLVLVEGLIWLPQLFGQVFVPESVKEEVLPGKSALMSPWKRYAMPGTRSA
jgi:predicted nucleic acid-binding protein